MQVLSTLRPLQTELKESKDALLAWNKRSTKSLDTVAGTVGTVVNTELPKLKTYAERNSERLITEAGAYR